MLPNLHPLSDLNAAQSASPAFDALVVVSSTPLAALKGPLGEAVTAAAKVDGRVGQDTLLLPNAAALGGRLILAPTGPLNRDQDDVRRFAKAAGEGLKRARDAGATRPCLMIDTANDTFKRSVEVALLGGLGSLWKPLEAREVLGEGKMEPITDVGFITPAGAKAQEIAQIVSAMEAGRRLGRDISGTNQERMTPIKAAKLCQAAFKGTGVRVSVIEDQDVINKEYPLLAAVGRASLAVPRHHPRVVRMEYVGEGEIEETVFMVGKGVTFDTGGLDIKCSGHMAGMSRDKGGAGAAAGFVLTAAHLKPKGIRIVCELALVRNSVGSDAFAADEIITAHSGTRVRIGNTDAEGRLAMADLLSHHREEAKDATNPHLFTVATLTGHAGRAVGPYSIALDNGPAHKKAMAMSLMDIGDTWGDCFAFSRLRPEDFDFVRPRTEADDVLSCNNEPSSGTPRGHQFPMAFLIKSAGLEPHGRHSDTPIPYTHLDIGGSGVEGGDWQHGAPTSAPVVALAARFLLRS